MTSMCPPPGSTVSATSSARMKTYGTASVAQQTRHARRIYVGGIPPMYTDEDGLRNFLNSVLAQGLGEDNNHSYILSVYINHKKCFAFVELKSIELATACLSLDGIIFRNIVLRILRANEYKPELVPSNALKEIHLDLSQFQFGTPNAPAHYSTADTEENFLEKSLDSIVCECSSLANLESNSLVFLGYPYEDIRRANLNIRGLGCAYAPKCFRSSLRRYKYGSLENPEYATDISKLKILDVGDILPGKSTEDTRDNLTTSIAELLLRGVVPIVIGGSNEVAYASVAGLLGVSGCSVGVVSVSAMLDTKLLEDMRFCTLDNNKGLPTCGRRYVQFAVQVR